MKTELVEITNQNKILRGIVTLPTKVIDGFVICIHGFERCSTTEKKFKSLADKLVTKNIASLRIDFSGSGLSDGKFSSTTIETQSNELINIISYLKEKFDINKISVVAHSLGACVVTYKIQEILKDLNKLILIAPALNQGELLRYWYVVSQMKKINQETEVTWTNYRKYLDEGTFQLDCNNDNKMVKASYIHNDYCLEAQDIDTQENLKDINIEILHIHGSEDKSVPLESLDIPFEKQIIVDGGNHDLERPNQIDQWLSEAVEFLSKQ